MSGDDGPCVGYQPWTEARGVLNFARACSRGGYNGVDWSQWGHHRDGPRVQYTAKYERVQRRSPSPGMSDHLSQPLRPTRNELVLHPKVSFCSTHRQAPHVSFPTVVRAIAADRSPPTGVQAPSPASKVAHLPEASGRGSGRDQQQQDSTSRPAPGFGTGRVRNRIHWMPMPGGGTIDDIGNGAYDLSQLRDMPLKNPPSVGSASASVSAPASAQQQHPKPSPKARRKNAKRVVKCSPAGESNREKVMTHAFLKGGREDCRIPAYLALTVLVNAPPKLTAGLEYPDQRDRVLPRKKNSSIAFCSKARGLLSSSGAPVSMKQSSSVHDVEALTADWVKRNYKTLVEDEVQLRADGKPPPCSVSDLLACGPIADTTPVLPVLGDALQGGGGGGAIQLLPMPSKHKNVATLSMNLSCAREDDLQFIVTHASRERVAREVRQLECPPQRFIRPSPEVAPSTPCSASQDGKLMVVPDVLSV